MMDKTIRFRIAVLLLIFGIALFIEVNSYYDSLNFANSTWSYCVVANTIYVYGILIIIMSIIAISFYIIGLPLKTIIKIIKGAQNDKKRY